MVAEDLLLLHQVDDAREQRHVGAGEQAHADHVDVLLRGRRDDLLGAAVQAGVDDLHAGVAQRAGDHLHAAVVAVEPDLGQQDPDRLLGSFVSPPRATARRSPRMCATRPPRRRRPASPAAIALGDRLVVGDDARAGVVPVVDGLEGGAHLAGDRLAQRLHQHRRERVARRAGERDVEARCPARGTRRGPRRPASPWRSRSARRRRRARRPRARSSPRSRRAARRGPTAGPSAASRDAQQPGQPVLLAGGDDAAGVGARGRGGRRAIPNASSTRSASRTDARLTPRAAGRARAPAAAGRRAAGARRRSRPPPGRSRPRTRGGARRGGTGCRRR